MFTNIEDNEWHIVSAKDPTLPGEASNHASNIACHYFGLIYAR
jgi:hypothetical protein